MQMTPSRKCHLAAAGVIAFKIRQCKMADLKCIYAKMILRIRSIDTLAKKGSYDGVSDLLHRNFTENMAHNS